MVAILVSELVQSAIGEKRVTLHCAGWDGYRAIAIALGEGRSTRLTFDRGVLEVVELENSPTFPNVQKLWLYEFFMEARESEMAAERCLRKRIREQFL